MLTLFRILITISIGLYAIPILIYTILFKKMHVVFEIMLGAVSAIFYSPTYLNILNIFALCRIDDISWGTKGLNQKDSKSVHL